MNVRRKRAVQAVLGVLLAPWLLLLVGMLFVHVPEDEALSEPSLRVYDREHRLLREVRNQEGARRSEVPLAALGDRMQNAVIAAEDARFRKHMGVDPLSVVRAALSAIKARHIVSGASTISMQVARTVVPHRKNALGKLTEASLALKLELYWGKSRILETYLNRVTFGPQLVGAEAAAQHYFNKPASALSFAEAATIASLAKSPIRYPKDLERLRTRRNYVLARMRELGFMSQTDYAIAEGEPLALGHFTAPGEALHFVQALQAGKLGVDVAHRTTVETTLSSGIQALAENAVSETVHALADRHVTSASAIVIDNATGEVLAYVGAPESRTARSAQNYVDSVLAERQPGSALKPFVYGLALERLGMGPWTTLPDTELRIDTPTGVYVPQNYDNRYHGPVRMREALANSYNIPAVYLADRLGAAAVLAQLQAVGFGTLRGSAEAYGVAIALGDGEVRLLDLARAYSTLARGGVDKAPVFVREERGDHAAEMRVMPAWVANTLTHMLSDNSARLSAFGRGSALEFPYPVAAKTGTSKSYRDNWTVGYTHTHTVAVWAGNVDASPMEGVSGVTGAGRIFHEIMVGLGAPSAGLVTEPSRVRICALTGKQAERGCDRVLEEVRYGEAQPVAGCEVHGAHRSQATAALSLVTPRTGTRFLIDPDKRSEHQSIEVRASIGASTLYVDDRLVGTSASGTFRWNPSLGEHTLWATSKDGARSDSIRVRVDAM
jgi:penicillin-binding protein 1C